MKIVFIGLHEVAGRYVVSFDRKCLGQNVEGKKLLRGIFDKETRRKAVAVVGAAMELRARFGLGEPRGMVRKWAAGEGIVRGRHLWNG